VKKSKKLVPLMPILVRLGACGPARAWVAAKNFATFREAWGACPDGEWMSWLLRRDVFRFAGLDFSDREIEVFWADRPRASRDYGVRYGQEYRDELRSTIPAAEIERALYDFAVREGLVS
jgi:hypothetical protein